MRNGQSLQGLFVQRCISEYRAGRVVQALMLLKAAVGYAWFRAVYEFPRCWLAERLPYVPPAGGEHDASCGDTRIAPHGSVLVYLGPAQQVERFVQLSGALGFVPGHNAWPHRAAAMAPQQAALAEDAARP